MQAMTNTTYLFIFYLFELNQSYFLYLLVWS